MAGDERPPASSSDVVDGLTRRLRLVVAGVITTLIVILVIVDDLGRLFFDPTFRTSDFIFGTLIGALLLLLGVETLNRLPRVGGGK